MQKLLLCTIFLCIPVFGSGVQDLEKLFIEGERAAIPQKRDEVLNQAIEEALSKNHQQNSRLLYNLGNSYYYLKEYPLALVYYYKALKLMPRHPKLWHNLKVVHKDLGLDPPHWVLPLSFYERFFVFISFSLLTFLLYILGLFLPRFQLKKIKKALFGISILLFLGFSYENFFPKVEAIVLDDSHLHHDKGKKFLRSGAPILKKGQKVVILSIEQDDKWALVKIAPKQQGYCSLNKLGII